MLIEMTPDWRISILSDIVFNNWTPHLILAFPASLQSSYRIMNDKLKISYKQNN